MNEHGSNMDDSSLRNELYVFSPNGGVSLNVNPKNLPQNTSQVKFELIGTNPLIKTNKGGNFSEYDHYIEDPTNPEIKSAVLNSISCIDGTSYIKKDGIDIIYCSFEAFNNSGRPIRMEDPHVMFYINMLLIYSPELRNNTLNQYFDTLYKIMENDEVSLDLKYLLTSKAIEVEWERCNFGKYSLFRAFFSNMKKFFKISPLFNRNLFTDEVLFKAYQDVLIRTLNGRAFAIAKFMVDSEEPLNLLMLTRTIEWFQKLEANKILTNFNENYFIHKTRGNIAVEFVKQMYGKAPLIVSVPGFEAENGVVIEPKPSASTENKAVVANGKTTHTATTTVIDSATKPTSIAKKPTETRRKSSEFEKEQQKQQIKSSPAQKPQKKDEWIQIKKTEPVVAKIKQEMIVKEEQKPSSSSQPKKVKTERIATFFSLYDEPEFESDFGGRVSNFLKKATKMGYSLVPEEETKIENIITKFMNDFTEEQKSDISRNYKKFCLDYSIHTNSKIISSLENTPVVAAAVKSKVSVVKTEEAIKKKPEPRKSSDEIDLSPPPKVFQKKENKPVVVDSAKNQQFKRQQQVSAYVEYENAKKQEREQQKNKKTEIEQPEARGTADSHIIYCNNVSPMAEQINTNKRLFERTSRISEDLERILNKKFAYLKVGKIGSIGCGYATSLTNNFNMVLFRKDLTVRVKELEILQDVYNFLQENYFKPESQAQITVKFDKQTILFVDKKETELTCSITFDKLNVYTPLTQKIKLILSAQPSILQVFYKLQTELRSKNLLKQDGISSYLLIIMLITSCQLEFQGKKYLPGLKENTIHLSNQKVGENELLKRFTTIFQNCIQQEVSRNYYFSILNGCLCDIASSKSHYRNHDCLVYLEDPFQTEVNCSKSLTTKGSEDVVQFIQNLYSSHGI